MSAAEWEYGHGGYTGSLAEKTECTVINATPQPRDEAIHTADAMLDADAPRISDKWGPAGALAFTDNTGGHGWLFFGWSPS